MRVRTWWFEAAVIAAILVVTTLASGGEFREWVGSLAVFLVTRQMSIADRMSEAEAAREHPSTECHGWLVRYHLLAEVLFALYFLLHGAHVALVGVGIMLAYPLWRRLYRGWRPRDR